LRYGVPFDVAFSLPNDMRVAMLIVFGENEGGKFDWAALRWQPRS
jgi:hypothetical protein